MQYNKPNFKVGWNWRVFSITATEKKEVETYSNVKNVLKCCPHSLLFKSSSFFSVVSITVGKGSCIKLFVFPWHCQCHKEVSLHELYIVHNKATLSRFYPSLVCPCFYMLYNHNNIIWSSSALFYLQKSNVGFVSAEPLNIFTPDITSNLELKHVLKEFVAVGPCNSG